MAKIINNLIATYVWRRDIDDVVTACIVGGFIIVRIISDPDSEALYNDNTA